MFQDFNWSNKSVKGIFSSLCIIVILMVYYHFPIAQNYVPGELIVNLEREFLPISVIVDQDSNIVTNLITIDSLNRLFRCDSFEKVYKGDWSPMQGLYLLRFPDTLNLDQIHISYKDDNHIRLVTRNYLNIPSVIPNDSLYSYNPPVSCRAQWAHDMDHMESELGWEISKGDTFIVIMIMDSGVDWMHNDLDENMWINPYEDLNQNGRFDNYSHDQGGDLNEEDDDPLPSDGLVDDVVGWDFWDQDRNPECENVPKGDHGDYVGGTAAAVTNNISGGAGTNWYSKLMAARTKNIVEDAKALAYAIRHGADIVNMSFTFSSFISPDDSLLFKELLDSACTEGLVLVASVGNDSKDTVCYPAGYSSVIAVAGTDSLDVKHGGSNYGNYVNVSAPWPNRVPARSKWWDPVAYDWKQGTSISAPFVSGLAGLIKGQYHTLWSGAPPPTNVITNDQIRAVIDTSSDDIYDIPGNYPYTGKLGFGRINTFKALLAISRGDVDNDRQIGLADVTYMINYLFSGGPPPIPDSRIMDCDCSGGPGLSDITWLIGYLFKDGPKPRTCFKY